MAVVYKNVQGGPMAGKPVVKAMAHTYEVQFALTAEVEDAKARAQARLARHRHDGHSQIETSEGRVDRYLTLSDERGLKAAYAIEIGRSEGINPDGTRDSGMAGLQIISGAFNITTSNRKLGPRRPRVKRPKRRKRKA